MGRVVYLAEVHFPQCFVLRDRPVQSGITLAHYDKQMRHTLSMFQWPSFGRMSIYDHGYAAR
jgi:hypothetical protein